MTRRPRGTLVATKTVALLLALLVSASAANVTDAVTTDNESKQSASTDSCTAASLCIRPVAEGGLQNQSLTLRALIIVKMPPFAVLEENIDNNENTPSASANNELVHYRGLMPDIMREIQRIAFQEDGVSLTFSLDPVENSFENDVFQSSLDSLAVDCNTTGVNPKPWEDCQRYDLGVGPYWPNLGDRSLKSLFTPPLTETGSATARYTSSASSTNRQQQESPVKSLEIAEILGAPICMDGGDFSANYGDDIRRSYPNLNVTHYCDTQQHCLDLLRNPEECALFIGDELVLRYESTADKELLVTSENIFRQFIAWAINARLDPTVQFYLRKWVYKAKETGFLDRLFNDYFSVYFCPLGKAGADCTLPCHPAHGVSNPEGVCICDSTRWTGDDCSIELLEDYQLIPEGIKITAFVLAGINIAATAYCAVWLRMNRRVPQVSVAQPFFLSLVLLGCLISTSTIFAMAQESSMVDEAVPACMLVPWLYSVGFCITFGSLFAKIRRINILFQAAIKFQRIEVKTQDTLFFVGGILAIDVTVLLCWTILDPLEWQRVVVDADKYGTTLVSVGYCASEHWHVFTSLLAAFHFALMCFACYVCYITRNLPTLFCEGKYITLAMISNLQIFVVAVPVLVILGLQDQAETSFLLRSVVIWMNDCVVLFLIFGNLMGLFHNDEEEGNDERSIVSAAVRSASAAAKAREEATTRPASSSKPPTELMLASKQVEPDAWQEEELSEDENG